MAVRGGGCKFVRVQGGLLACIQCRNDTVSVRVRRKSGWRWVFAMALAKKAVLSIMRPPAATYGQGLMSKEQPVVGVIMGSRSDWPTMQKATDMLEAFGVAYEARVVSAHRTPERLVEYASTAESRGLKCIIAGAGGAAHLPGMAAAMTCLPVLGVPVESRILKGQDSLLSIVQMPAGVPVGTLAIGEAGAANAGILAASIIALLDADVAKKLAAWRAAQRESVPHMPADDMPASAL